MQSGSGRHRWPSLTPPCPEPKMISSPKELTLVPSLSFRLPRSVALALLFVFILCGTATRAEQVKNLKPQGYVNDFAGVLSAQSKEKLIAICTELDQKAGAQVAIVTVSSLEGVPVEEFANDLFQQWGIGPKQNDRGALILLVRNDHRYRIEVGYGLEGILPDGKVGGFGREAVPLLRQNDYSGAVLLMTERVAQVIAADRNLTLNSLSGVPPPTAAQQPEDSVNGTPWVLILILIFFFFFPVLGFILRLLLGGFMGPPRGRGYGGGGWYGGGPWGGGGGSWGGGGGGFGGFGGGSSGGGGASGSW